ncbi:MAG: protein TolQ [Desulfobacteraceae bacterium]|nr:protein TolQ [Desulfobacteraceae bacterium]MBU4001876.1 protein TolQ [Pseudomonadota bacterium]MBU4055867.1 protein TolQ [Pseudomonadota bacterium]
MGSQNFDIIHMILSAGLMVQMVLFILLGFSVVSWSIIILKYRLLSKAIKESVLFTDFFWKSKDFSEAFAKAKELTNSPVSRLFRVAYMELKKLSKAGLSMTNSQTVSEIVSMNMRQTSSGNVKRAMERAINMEINRLAQMVPFLATTGNAAPFIGLFGTVWGIMNSFHGIGLRGSASLAVVAPGISEALIATATGLAAAIPSVMAYNYFTQKIRLVESDLRSFAADLMNIVDRDILPVEEK